MARDFAGTTADLATIGDVPDVDITGTAMTLAVWCWIDTLRTQMLVSKEGAAAATLGQYCLLARSSNWEFRISNGSVAELVTVNAAPPTATWSHYATRKNGTGAAALAAFFNGALVLTASSPLSIQNAAARLMLGQRDGGGGQEFPLDGRLAEVGIWDAALADEEILALSKGVSPLMIRVANLRGYWPLMGVGSPEADLSGGPNNAVLSGTVPVVDHPRGGRWSAMSVG